MKKLSLLSFIAVAVLFSACQLPEDQERKVASYPSVNDKTQKEITTIEQQRIIKVQKPEPKFTLDKIETFLDSDAYNGKRSVYVIKDLETGKEYIGVSGIGISERGNHISSKNNVPDER